MRFDRESWRKLYVAESPQHRLMSLFSRCLRDYLLRIAEPDGTLLRSSCDHIADLCKVIGGTKRDRKSVGRALEELVSVGYLSQDGKRLWITKYEEGQLSRSPGAVRQKRHRDRRRSVTRNGDSNVTHNGDSNVTNYVTNDETRRDETRDDENVTSPPSRFRMHTGWRPTEDSRQACLIGGAQAWALDQFVSQFVGFFVNKPDECTDADWNSRWCSWVSRGWNDASRRPRKPTTDPADEDAAMAARFE